LPILFDAHCLIDNGKQLIEIPASVIQALSPSGLIFIQDEPSAILGRRSRDATRVRPIRSLVELQEHQDRARAICGEYAGLLNLQLHLVEAGNEAGFTAGVTAIFTR
jgi:adenylate kinase